MLTLVDRSRPVCLQRESEAARQIAQQESAPVEALVCRSIENATQNVADLS